ncbi:Mitochondrial import inner membrane translocase subunit tim23 [Sorochytrium milnesiophthora]
MSSQQQQNQNDGQDFATVDSLLDGLNLNQAAKSLHPIQQLGSDVDYVFTDMLPYSSSSGGFVPSRGLGDDLCYGTGTAYLTALGVGGLWGLQQGLRQPLPVNSTKLRINAILNASTRRGPFLANSVGIVALMYNTFNYSAGLYVGKQHDVINSVASATLSGMIFKSTAGLRSAGIAGALCGAFALTWQGVKRFKDQIPIVAQITSRTYM